LLLAQFPSLFRGGAHHILFVLLGVDEGFSEIDLVFVQGFYLLGVHEKMALDSGFFLAVAVQEFLVEEDVSLHQTGVRHT
jgi:hypothetical protein